MKSEMKAINWDKLENIFHTAISLPREDRKTFLQRECADDATLLTEVESLIESFESTPEFLRQPVFELGLGAIHETSQIDLSGSTIGFYELKEKIGVGGMGEVYKAFDNRLNRYVALKFLSQSLKDDNSAKRQLVKEAQAAAALDHPNICAVHGFEQTDEHHFIVMQYVEGKTLAGTSRKDSVSVEEFKRLTRQIVTAVAFAHSHGVIHRDLKPGNIMLNSVGQIKVLDFGLAKVMPQNQLASSKSNDEISRFSQNGLIIGTVSYMSPEQLRGERLDFRSDIFSVGIILYELITRKNPFSRQSQAETIAALLSEKPALTKENAPRFPESLLKIVEKCLDKDKAARFQSAAEILVELDNAESKNYRKSASKRRTGFFIETAFATVILLAVLTFLFFYNGKNQRRTLAILPITMENESANKEYLADGLTQRFIEKLSNLSELKVINESIVVRYKGKFVEPQTAGKELGADVVFVGSILKRDDNLYLKIKLVRVSDGFVLDSDDQQKIEEAKLIELQENISARIIGKIKSNLTDEDKSKLTKRDTESAEAINQYLQGRYYLKRRKDGEDVEKAFNCFFNAKEIDQKYAKAWTGLADAYLTKIAPGVKNAITPVEAVKSARKAAEKAIELDNTLAESYNSLGLIEQRYEWNWSEAENYFRIAISRDPEFLPARFGLINVLKMQQRYDDAFEEINKIKQYDPFSVNSDIQIALIYYQKRDYDQTDRVLSDLLQKFPDDMRIKYVRVYQLLNTKRFKEAVEILEPLYESKNEEDKVLAAAPLGFAFAKMDRRNEAMKIINDLEKFRKNNYVPAQEKALIYVGLGNFDKVFEFLTQSCAERYSSLPGWVNDPIVDEVKSDPRFAEIKKCVNL